MLVIINADDLGMNPEVNASTFDMMASRALTSATVMANGPDLMEVIRALPLFPECSFGIHLNLTEFRPLTPQRQLAPLLDENGCFREKAIRQVKFTPSLLRAIAREWAEQIERLLALGVKVSHVDSHHHVHTIPPLLPTLKHLQAKYGLARVRISKNIYGPHPKVPKLFLFGKYLYNQLLRHYYYPAKTTSGFTDLLTFHANGRQREPRHSTVEIMVHPGGLGCEAETALLGSPWPTELPFIVKLINYHQL